MARQVPKEEGRFALLKERAVQLAFRWWPDLVAPGFTWIECAPAWLAASHLPRCAFAEAISCCHCIQFDDAMA